MDSLGDEYLKKLDGSKPSKKSKSQKKPKIYHNMNHDTRTEINEWCNTWDDNQCQRCGTSFKLLEKEAEEKARIQGMERKLPVYVIDHDDGDSSHNDGYIAVDSNGIPVNRNKRSKSVNKIWHKFGNCRRLCWPCNRLAGIIKRKSATSDRMTREKRDRLVNEQVYLFEVETQINERGHVCYKAIIKAGKNICDSSEVTCGRYLDTEIKTPENPKGKFHIYPYECEGKFCNGSHVSWANVKPDIIIEQERVQLEREWEMEYGYPRGYEQDPEDAVRQWNMQHIHKKWVSKEQFVNNRLETTW